MILLVIYVFLFFVSIRFNGVSYTKVMESYNWGNNFDAFMWLLLQMGCFIGTIFSVVYSVKQFILVIR